MTVWLPVEGWVQKGDNLTPILTAAGVYTLGIDGVLHSNNPELALQINAAFDYVADRKTAKLAELADFRWSKEVGGITIDGMVIETTDRSKTLVTGALMMAQANPAATFQFKTTDNQYVQIDAAQMIGVYQAIGAHVQTCFAREQEVAALINALETAQEVIDFDIAGAWTP